MDTKSLRRNGRTIKKKKIFFMFEWLENLSPDFLRVGGKRRD